MQLIRPRLTGSTDDVRTALARALPFVSLCVFALAIRAPFLSVPLTNDEGAYALWARLWTRDFQVYREFMFARPQAVLVLYELIEAVSSGSLLAIRWAAAVFNCGTVLAIWMVAKRCFDERAAWASATIYALFSTAPRIEGFTANAELFTFLPLALNALLCWQKRWLLAGAAVSVAFQIKPSGIEGCVLLCSFALLDEARWRDRFRAVLLAACGFTVASLPMLLHAHFVGWHAFFFNLVTLRRQSYNAEFATLAAQKSLLLDGVADTFSSWLLPVVLGLFAVPAMDSRRRKFFGCWAVGAFVGMQVGLYWHWHFFQQILPPAAVLAGAGLFAQARPSIARLRWGAGLLALGFFVSRDLSLLGRPPEEISWRVYGRPSYLYGAAAARYVAENTNPDDLLYVAFGQPEIYYLANRRPAVMTQLFNAHARWFDKSWQDAVDALRSSRPALVLWAQPPPRNRMTSAEFAELLAVNYVLERNIGNIRVYRRAL